MNNFNQFQVLMGLSIATLVGWSLVVWLWMYLTRIPAIRNSNMKLDRYAIRGEQMKELPAKVRWVADNYNHLTEQPTHYYAISLISLFLNTQNVIPIAFSWAYVIFRIAHSIYQIKINIIPVRFLLFTFSSISLLGLTIITFLDLAAFLK